MYEMFASMYRIVTMVIPEVHAIGRFLFGLITSAVASIGVELDSHDLREIRTRMSSIPLCLENSEL